MRVVLPVALLAGGAVATHHVSYRARFTAQARYDLTRTAQATAELLEQTVDQYSAVLGMVLAQECTERLASANDWGDPSERRAAHSAFVRLGKRLAEESGGFRALEIYGRRGELLVALDRNGRALSEETVPPPDWTAQVLPEGRLVRFESVGDIRVAVRQRVGGRELVGSFLLDFPQVFRRSASFALSGIPGVHVALRNSSGRLLMAAGSPLADKRVEIDPFLIPTLNGQLELSIDPDELYADLRGREQRSIIVMVSLLAVLLGALWKALHGTVLDTVLRLTETIATFQRGDPLPPPKRSAARWDELDELEHTLIETIHASRRATTEMASLNESLEERVTERTEQLQVYATELERERDRAESATVAKSAFLASMSHEIRTPMTAIQGYADLLADSVESPDDREAVACIRTSGQHLLELVNDILDLSKIESGRLDVETVQFSLFGMLDEVHDIMSPRARRKGVSLCVEHDSSVPEHVVSDPLRVRQVLLNLVSNAAKFTSAGEIRVRVAWEKLQEGEGALTFEVADTGIGMTSEQADRLFRPFTQADSSTTRRFGGTGLGLTISKRLAELMDGELELVSTAPGEGSRFRFRVPCRAAPLELVPDRFRSEERVEGATSTVAEVRVAHSPRPAVPARILLAEDNPTNRLLIVRILERIGAEVSTVVNGREAVQCTLEAAAEGRPFDIILMDVQMPVLDGLSATAELREAGYRGTIIALTAGAMRESRDLCLEAGCDEFVPKPVPIEELHALIERFMEKARTHAA